MTSTLGAMVLTKAPAIFATFAILTLAIIAASASRTQPGPGACEAILLPCSWYVGAIVFLGVAH